MGSYIAKRLLLMLPTLLGILLITFAMIQFVPGGPVEQLVQKLQGHGGGGEAGQSIGPGMYRGASGLQQDQLDQFKRYYGFDKPATTRFWLMLKHYAHFDLGDSYFHQQTVWALILQKMPVSISLGLWTFLISWGVSVPLGIRKAVADGSRFDTATTVAMLVGYAIPGFMLGVALLVLFGGGSFWQVFPLRGLVSDNWQDLSLWHKLLDYGWHMTLPITCMVLGSFATTALLTKNSMLEEMRRQYVLTARAKGLPENTVLWKHVFRNSLIPLITGFPAAFIGAFFTGSLLIENLFSLDGLGRLSYESVLRRDYPVVLGTLFIFTLMGLATKLINDLMYVWVDPRIHFEGGH